MVRLELEDSRKQAAFDADRAKRRLADADNQQQKLLAAHYADAVPLDMMKSEMQRLMREKAAAETELRMAQGSGVVAVSA